MNFTHDAAATAARAIAKWEMSHSWDHTKRVSNELSIWHVTHICTYSMCSISIQFWSSLQFSVRGIKDGTCVYVYVSFEPKM